MSLPVMIQYNESSKQTELLFDDESRQYLDLKPTEYLNQLCLSHGSTIKGRQDAYQQLTGFHTKAAVLISERYDNLYFPTLSPSNPMCVWLDDSKVLRIKAQDATTTLVLFESGIKIYLSVNFRIIRNQMKRCEEYRKILYEKQCTH